MTVAASASITVYILHVRDDEWPRLQTEEKHMEHINRNENENSINANRDKPSGNHSIVKKC